MVFRKTTSKNSGKPKDPPKQDKEEQTKSEDEESKDPKKPHEDDQKVLRAILWVTYKSYLMLLKPYCHRVKQSEAEWTGVSSAYNEKYAVSHGRCQRSAHALKIKFGHPSGGGELTPQQSRARDIERKISEEAGVSFSDDISAKKDVSANTAAICPRCIDRRRRLYNFIAFHQFNFRISGSSLGIFLLIIVHVCFKSLIPHSLATRIRLENASNRNWKSLRFKSFERSSPSFRDRSTFPGIMGNAESPRIQSPCGKEERNAAES